MSKVFELRVDDGRRRHILIRAIENSVGYPESNHTKLDLEVKHAGKVVFPLGSLYCGVSAGHAIDSDEAKKLVLSTVGMYLGDTDEDYFTDYTPEQMAWAEEYHQRLQWEIATRYPEHD